MSYRNPPGGAVLHGDAIRRCAKTGKVRFRTELDAKIVLAGRQAKDKGEVRTYKCSFCNGWHLTSMKLNREEPRSP